MKVETVKIEYCIALSKDEMTLILKREQDSVASLYDELMGIEDVTDVEYSGFLGPYTWVTIKSGDVNNLIINRVKAVIEAFIHGK